LKEADKKRLEKVEASLSTKETFLTWMEEAHRYNSLFDYTKTLKGKNKRAWPLPKLIDQVKVNTTRANKDKDAEQIKKAVRNAVRDLVFLFNLHLNCNKMVTESLQLLQGQVTILSLQLQRLLEKESQSLWMDLSWKMYSQKLSYPLDPDTAAAVKAADGDEVITWDEFQDGGFIDQWLMNAYRKEGRTELPPWSYLVGRPIVIPDIEVRTREELGTLFSDGGGMQRFLDGEDFQSGFADVTDAEYDERWEAVLGAVKDVVKKGGVQAGRSVTLDSLPQAFLRKAPLIDNQWIDRHIIELAEWGARMKAKGYEPKGGEDRHPLAWEAFTLIVAGEVSSEEYTQDVEKETWEQTLRHMEKFPGKTRDKGGRQYVCFDDYRKWRGRKVKGNLGSQISEGFLRTSWNVWVEGRSKETSSALKSVEPMVLESWLNGYPYHYCRSRNHAFGELKVRYDIANSLSKWFSDDENQTNSRSKGVQTLSKDFLEWKEFMDSISATIECVEIALEHIEKVYLDGVQVQFPSTKSGLEELLEDVEREKERFEELHVRHRGLSDDDDDIPDKDTEVSPFAIAVQGYSRLLCSLVTDMAKTVALDQIGEFRNAEKLIDKYL